MLDKMKISIIIRINKGNKQMNLKRFKWVLSLHIVLSASFVLITGLIFSEVLPSDLWKITAYCSCKICCNKSDGITASGHKLKRGDKIVACNWLPFGTKVLIGKEIYIVQDRGAKSLFGSKTNHIKHLDIWMENHTQAKQFGVKWLKVKIL